MNKFQYSLPINCINIVYHFIVPCTVPEIPHGEFTLPKTEQNLNLTIPFDTPINDSMEIPNGVVVEFNCEEGYSVQGSPNLKCWYGDWTVTSFPECSPGKIL